MFPIDQRKITRYYNLPRMKPDQIVDYIDEKNAFKALSLQQNHRSQKVREKDKFFRDVYLKSSIHRIHFDTHAMRNFKKICVDMNQTKKKEEEKEDREAMKVAQLRHKQNKRASEKRGIPKIDYISAQKLLQGKFHTEEEDEEEEKKPVIEEKVEVPKLNQDEQQKPSELEKIHRFEQKMMALDEKKKPKEDEVPIELRQDLDLPPSIQGFDLNF